MMDLDLLCAAVREAPSYLNRFTRRSYPGAFREYAQRFSPAYREAVGETAGDETALNALADAILTELERGWNRRFFGRGALRVSEKQMVVSYLSPLLLGLEDPLCPRFAQVLQERWAARWPKDAYQTADYATIKGGFRYALMGFEMRPPERERED